MKEDDEAISSLKLQMKTFGEFSFVTNIWTITESRTQEWRSAQAAINSYGYDFMVCSSLLCPLRDICDYFQLRLEAVRGSKSVGFVAIDDFEVFTEEEEVDCPYDPPEANPNPITSSSTSPGGINPCTFEEDLCGWEIQPEGGVFMWERTSVNDLEDKGQQGPETDSEGGKEGEQIRGGQKATQVHRAFNKIVIFAYLYTAGQKHRISRLCNPASHRTKC